MLLQLSSHTYFGPSDIPGDMDICKGRCMHEMINLCEGTTQMQHFVTLELLLFFDRVLLKYFLIMRNHLLCSFVLQKNVCLASTHDTSRQPEVDR